MSYQTPRNFHGLVHDPNAVHEMKIVHNQKLQLVVCCQCGRMEKQVFTALTDARNRYLEHITGIGSDSG